MSYRDYVCDDCGFSSEEEPGVYYCPRCGAKMRVARASYYGGDASAGFGKWLVYIVFVIVVYPLCFASFGFLVGSVVFVVVFLLLRFWLNGRVRDRAERRK